jgi:hypothetical protein
MSKTNKFIPPDGFKGLLVLTACLFGIASYCVLDANPLEDGLYLFGCVQAFILICRYTCFITVFLLSKITYVIKPAQKSTFVSSLKR